MATYKADNVLVSKSEDFALRIVKLYKYLCYSKQETVISKQLLRSGTSIGANVAESQFAQSTPDFLTKLYISLKETSETAYWLKLLQRAGYLEKTEYQSISADCDELLKILASIVKKINCKNK